MEQILERGKVIMNRHERRKAKSKKKKQYRGLKRPSQSDMQAKDGNDSWKS